MYVCMFVRNRFTIEMYGLRIVYVPFGTCHLRCHRISRDGMEIEVEDWEDRRLQMYGRQLTAQSIDERQQDNGDKKQPAPSPPVRFTSLADP